MGNGGVNDMTILGGIIIFLLFCGGVLPFVHNAFGGSASTYSANSTLKSFEENQDISGTDVLFSAIGMLFWSFGNIAWYVDLCFFMPIRFIGLLIIARNIWVGGGG